MLWTKEDIVPSISQLKKIASSIPIFLEEFKSVVFKEDKMEYRDVHTYSTFATFGHSRPQFRCRGQMS